MGRLIRFNWQAFDLAATIKVTVGMALMLVLVHMTGEPWLATALAALFAWLANVPGPLTNRVGGMLAFAAGAIVITLVSGQIQLDLWPNIVAVSSVGFLGTVALARGMRGFMVGFSLISWAIYGPFLVATTSVENCILAIVAGTSIVVLLNIIGGFTGKKGTQPAVTTEAPAPAEQPSAGPSMDYIFAYAITVALVLALTTYYGWVELKTDPTLMAGGAFYVIGFNVNKTWVAGIGRVLGLVAGVFLGLLIAKLLGPGLMLDVIMIVACGLSFGAAGVHPGAWMFFFMIFVAIGWHGLEREAFDLTTGERFYGELAGIAAAMVAIVFLQWWQNRAAVRRTIEKY